MPPFAAKITWPQESKFRFLRKSTRCLSIEYMKYWYRYFSTCIAHPYSLALSLQQPVNWLKTKLTLVTHAAKLALHTWLKNQMHTIVYSHWADTWGSRFKRQYAIKAMNKLVITQWTLFIICLRLLFYFIFRTRSICFRNIYRLQMALGV